MQAPTSSNSYYSNLDTFKKDDTNTMDLSKRSCEHNIITIKPSELSKFKFDLTFYKPDKTKFSCEGIAC